MSTEVPVQYFQINDGKGGATCNEFSLPFEPANVGNAPETKKGYGKGTCISNGFSVMMSPSKYGFTPV